MIKALIFGGTTEGRILCEECEKHKVPAMYCVATSDGARAAEGLRGVEVNVGRLSAHEMTDLIKSTSPEIVIDATHPYAAEVSRNLSTACKSCAQPMLRVMRESEREDGCMEFSSSADLIEYLKNAGGNIFATTGASYAKILAELPDYKNRVWMRVLPSMESLRICLAHGYSPERLVCMQGPFSEELNKAMFKTANAGILVTKNSGAAGGFREKINAARSLGMLIAVLSKPDTSGGVTLRQATIKIAELSL